MVTYKEVEKLLPKGVFESLHDSASRYFLGDSQLRLFLRELAKRYSVFVRAQKEMLDLVIVDRLDAESLEELNPSEYLDSCHAAVIQYNTKGNSIVAPRQVYMLYLYDTQVKVDFLIANDFDLATVSQVTSFIGKM